MYDAKFHVFQKVNDLLDLFIPEGWQLSLEQIKAIHKFSENISQDLLSGEYK